MCRTVDILVRYATLIGVTGALLGCSASPPASDTNNARETVSNTESLGNAAVATVDTGAPGTPTFDCAKAEYKAEELICRDGNLARMDQETARLYRLALGGPHMDRARAAELKRDQRDFVRNRNECWKGVDLHQCVMTSYVRRIHKLRQGYADARTKDDEGSSTGPYAYICEGLDAGIAATFVNTDPGAVYLEWLEFSMALDHVPSGSGAKYTGRWNGADWTFWTQGDEATFERPGEKPLQCRREEIG